MATLTHAELEQLWIDAGGPQAQADVAASIAQAESGGCVTALAGPVDIRPVQLCTWHRTTLENSCGLWQINLYAHPSYSAPSIFDPLTNARAAVSISNHGASFGAWTTYTNGAYRQFLSGSTAGIPGTAGTPAVGSPAGALSGWHQLTHALAKGLIGELHSSDHMVAAANRRLARAGRR